MNLYLARNLVNDMMYVGKTTQTIDKRWKQHVSVAMRKTGDSYFHNAIRRYGVDSFAIEPLILLDEDFTGEESLNRGERLMIRLLRVNCELYNMTDGGDGLVNPTEITRRKIGDAHRGKPESEETRRKNSESHKGHPVSEETRRKIASANSEAQKGNSYRRGKKASDETRSRMSESQKGNQNAKKPHCKYGHERTPENLDSHYNCRICQRIRNAARSTQYAAEQASVGGETR